MTALGHGAYWSKFWHFSAKNRKKTKISGLKKHFSYLFLLKIIWSNANPYLQSLDEKQRSSRIESSQILNSPLLIKVSNDLNNNNKPNCRTAFALYARGQKYSQIFPIFGHFSAIFFLLKISWTENNVMWLWGSNLDSKVKLSTNQTN